ncbi:hypothetical protein C6341_g22477 [Phytophthora cactorum]|nr:hypothetical protein C6341_g22477 [Phytophthora cactorum]
MAPDVASNDGFGPGQLAKVKTPLTTRTSVTITGRALLNLFPHLYERGNAEYWSSEKSSLVAKLLEQRIVMDGKTLFQWERATDCEG